jgi:hypothetical protein
MHVKLLGVALLLQRLSGGHDSLGAAILACHFVLQKRDKLKSVSQALLGAHSPIRIVQ